MSSLNVCSKTKSGNILTAKGRLAYPALFKPHVQQDDDGKETAKYQASLVFPKAADLAVLAAAVEDCAKEKWGADYKTKFKVRKPFLKTEDYPKIGADAAAFPVFIRANANPDKGKPQIVNAQMQNVDESKADQVYPGRWARLSLRVYWYDHKKGGKGISFGLQNVQLLDDDEPFAAMRVAADQEFDAMEGVAAGDGGASTDALFE